jgi:hypothetical protein
MTRTGPDRSAACWRTAFLIQLDDWAFRIFFRSIMDLQGGGRRSKYAHIGVQVDPDEVRNIDPQGARHYLEEYFQDDSINIYWGQAIDFLQELAAQRGGRKEQ